MASHLVEPDRPTRPARALLGWMEPNEALLTLACRRTDMPPSPEDRRRVVEMRQRVAERPEGVRQNGIVEAPPQSLAECARTLQSDPAAAALLGNGWNLAVVHLPEIVAVQPTVHKDHAEERTADLDPDDLVALARATVLIGTPQQIPAQFDNSQKAWIFSSANPNLRIVAAGVGKGEGGNAVIGFSVALMSSFLRVAHYQGRYLLVDGYHRALGILLRNITRVPALVGDVAAFEGLGLPAVGMLPHDAYLGQRPPFLADYLDDNVAADVRAPVTQKTIVISGLEVQAGG